MDQRTDRVSGLGLRASEPDLESTIRITTDADNVATIWMDAPGKSVNTCSRRFYADLAEALTAIERDGAAGVIITSAKPRRFNAGADLFEIRKMSREEVADFLVLGQSIYNRIASLPMPTVAAINGDCLGGGFELSLACRYRVAADDGAFSIGLPEVKLGLIPGWGGTTRLPRTIGLRRALPILLAGKTLPPRKAQRAGLVDEVVRPEALLSAAKRVGLSGAAPMHPAWMDRVASRTSAIRRRILDAARRKTNQLTHGNYPAPIRLIGVVGAGYERGFDAGLEAERHALLDLAEGDAGRNLLRLFFLRQGAKQKAAEHVAAKPREVKHAAVIGGGTMGSGIVHSLIRAGIPVRLAEVDPPAVSAALGRIRRMLDEDVAAGRMDRLGARHAFNRVSPTIDWTGLELADVVVEAVVETIEAKREVFARLDRHTKATAVLASNTSSLRIDEIARATLHPERVVGLHFFNPVPKMPLVEVVRGPQSDDPSLATAIALAGRLGKTPVLVGDAPGFMVNRILVPYLAEALVMASEGTPITTIDEAMKRWGMPMGPFELLDEIGLDIAWHVLKGLGGMAAPPQRVVAAFERAQAERWLGRKSGRGFYVYGGGKKRSSTPVANDGLIQVLAGGPSPQPSPGVPGEGEEAIAWRLVLPMVNEGARTLEEGVTDSTETIDLATVLGLGLAPFRGGILQFANTVGAEEVVRRLEDLAARHGARFAPAALLRDAAVNHRPIAPAPAPLRLEPALPQKQEHPVHT